MEFDQCCFYHFSAYVDLLMFGISKMDCVIYCMSRILQCHDHDFFPRY